MQMKRVKFVLMEMCTVYSIQFSQEHKLQLKIFGHEIL